MRILIRGRHLSGQLIVIQRALDAKNITVTDSSDMQGKAFFRQALCVDHPNLWRLIPSG
jgi:hypothetical protein